MFDCFQIEVLREQNFLLEEFEKRFQMRRIGHLLRYAEGTLAHATEKEKESDVSEKEEEKARARERERGRITDTNSSGSQSGGGGKQHDPRNTARDVLSTSSRTGSSRVGSTAQPSCNFLRGLTSH